MTTATISTNAFATKGDLVSASYTQVPATLMAIYADTGNRNLYALSEVNGQQIIRKMSITRDVTYARGVFKAAKKLIGQPVVFGVTAGWDSHTWFNEILEA